MIKITAIIPIYNAKAYISSLMCNLEEQDCKEFKAVFINDASTDDSLDLLTSAVSKASFKYEIINLQQNAGPGNARNLGIQSCDTEYACFIDADDSISPSFFSSLLKMAELHDADIVLSDAKKIFDDGTKANHLNLYRYRNEVTGLDLACTFDCGPWGKLFRTRIWHEHNLSFPVGLRAEDLAVIPLLLYYSRKIQIDTNAVYYYRQTTNSRSRTKGKYYVEAVESFYLLEKQMPCFEVMECRAAIHLAYGAVMNSILSGAPKCETDKHISYLKKFYPKAYKNKRLCCLPWQKRLFIFNTYKGFYWMAKIMVCLGK